MTTFREFFQLDHPSAGWVASVINSRDFNKIKKRIAKEIKGVKVAPSFYELLIRESAELLDIEGVDVLVWGWRKRKEILKYRDTEKYPPEKTYLVPLLEHSLTSEHAATIEPVYNGKSLAKIKFDITLKLNLDGAVLKIRNAKIEEIQYGSCTGSGNIAYSGFKILEKKTAPFTLPKTHKPMQPVQI